MRYPTHWRDLANARAQLESTEDIIGWLCYIQSPDRRLRESAPVCNMAGDAISYALKDPGVADAIQRVADQFMRGRLQVELASAREHVADIERVLGDDADPKPKPAGRRVKVKE